MDIIGIDRMATLALNGLHCPASDAFWSTITRTQLWFPMYALIAGLLFWRLGWKRGLVFVVALALMVLSADQLCNLVKGAVCRLRPCNDEFMVANGLHVLKTGRSFSFFSAHAANSFGFAWASLLAFREDCRIKYKGYAAFIFAWAVIVSLSRVFVGMHFVGDILVGAIVGSAIGVFFGFLGKYGCSYYIR